MSKKDWETDGTRNGYPIYCPIIAYGDCPYCDQDNLCHVKDPIEDCEDFAMFWESWDVWGNGDDVPDDVDETGYDPYLGCYTEDC